MFSINLIRIFEGPIHSELERIWRHFAERYRDTIRVQVLDNRSTQLNHAQALQKSWELEWVRPERYTIFTEFDFLPSEQLADESTWVKYNMPLVAAEYVTRSPASMQLIYHRMATGAGTAGAWLLGFDKRKVHVPLDFSRGIDPATDLGNQIPTWLLPTRDQYPRHFGVSVGPFGDHLFWSRHYNDPPDRVIAGCRMGDVQDGVRRAIEDWWKEETRG